MDIDYYAQYFAFEHNDWWFVARRRIVFDLISRYLEDPAPKNLLLDAGCGTGITLQHLAQFGHAVGVDNEPVALDFCRMRKERLLTCGALEDLPYPDGSFDVVTCLDVIEHIDDDERAISEVCRVIRPGGLLALTVPAFQSLWSDHDVINHHKRRYRRQQIRKLLGEGFSIELLSHYNTHLLPIAVTVRMLKKLEMALFPAAVRQVKAENTYLPRSINSLFASIFGSELFWLKRGSLPVGLSIICIARRKAESKVSSTNIPRRGV